MKVVVIEDEVDIAEALSYRLEREGFKVWVEHDGRRGVELVREKAPDLVLLDLMLPRLDGGEVCRLIRADASLDGTRIIMVTAKGDESDVLVGLGLGADDYVTKPFRANELIARARAVMRRGSTRVEGQRELIRHGTFTLDVLKHEVSVGERRVDLTATEFRLLRFLAGNPGRVFTRDQLLNRVIGENAVVIDRNIDVHVRSIRRKMGEGCAVIETIRGVGYRFTVS